MLSLFISALAAADTADHWAVLIAGSSGYGNYRHQADVCHAYHTVISKGIPAENVIVLAVDDIAHNSENPFPGKMFNKPTPKDTPGVDVYKGCKIDWSGKDVTPANFVKVLTGGDGIHAEALVESSTAPGISNSSSSATCSSSQRAGCAREETCCCTRSFFFNCQSSACCSSGSTCGSQGCVAPGPSPSPPTHKVLKSTTKSKVFVNFVDHGGVGLIGFPETTMHVKELAKALETMHTKGMYKELVFYLEACESGSMFPEGTLQPGMYATTAANAKESSWGTYCSPEDKVDGKSIGSCLGDLYSVMWMQDSDKAKAGETLEAQFTTVKQETTKSHVTEFGDKTVAAEPLVNFQGDSDATRSVSAPLSVADDAALLLASSIDARDAEIASAYSRFMATSSAASADELTTYIQQRKAAEARFSAIVTAVGVDGVFEQPTPDQVDFDCHYKAHSAYVRSCGEWTTGALKHSATLAKLCAATSGNAASITAAIASACPK